MFFFYSTVFIQKKRSSSFYLHLFLRQSHLDQHGGRVTSGGDVLSCPDQHGGRVTSGGDVLSCPDQHGGRVASGGDVFPLLSGAPLAQCLQPDPMIFLARAVAMVNHNFAAPLIMTFHSRGALAKLRVNLLRVEWTNTIQPFWNRKLWVSHLRVSQLFEV